MFDLIEKIFIGLLTGIAIYYTKCVQSKIYDLSYSC